MDRMFALTRYLAPARLGRFGEQRAAWRYRLRGWTILERNLKTRAGEVDLVVHRGKTIAIVEVKTARAIQPVHCARERDRFDVQPLGQCSLPQPRVMDQLRHDPPLRAGHSNLRGPAVEQPLQRIGDFTDLPAETFHAAVIVSTLIICKVETALFAVGFWRPTASERPWRKRPPAAAPIWNPCG